VRDDISRLTDLVNQLRSVRDQLKARSAALEPRKAEQSIADLIKTSDAAMKKADALEDKLHNPTAEVVYDILAMRGGTRLYSRLAPLQMWAVEDEGLPTLGMKTVLEEQEQELEALSAEVRRFITQDVAAVNQRAAQLGLAYVIVK
jgi:DNA-binding transcriptional MerR regulator